MISSHLLQKLTCSKNLLAFSGGGDSTALLFLLLEHNIAFDIAIVDYGVRDQSKAEVAYAHALAHQYKFTCHEHRAKKIDKDFEAKAREIRYDFFESLCINEKYTNLLTAHHLGDRLEWMLMQFCKGAGCIEMHGMQEIENRDTFTLIRPLLHLEKKELLAYLHNKNITFFEDSTNNNRDFTRNYFRHTFANPLLAQYKQGILKSFAYLDSDARNLKGHVNIKSIGDFAYFRANQSSRSNIYAIDKYLKTKHHMPTAHERVLLQTKKTVVLGRRFLVCWIEEMVCIAPFKNKDIKMDRNFKEEMRRLKIEPKLRPFFFENREIADIFISELSHLPRL